MPALNIFMACNTQWNVSHYGATGINYGVLPMLFDFYGVEDKVSMLRDIRIMEAAALDLFAEQRAASE